MTINPTSVSTQPQIPAQAYNANNTNENPPQGSNQPNTLPPASTFTRSSAPVDQAAIDRLLQQSRDQVSMFEQLVARVLNMQVDTFGTAFRDAMRAGNLRDMFTNINVDDATRAHAQELISEDGFFGVRQTSERILDFARAYAGNDPARIERMRSAFERGFGAATRAWGGELPSISQRTRDAVLQGFDDMMAAAMGTGTATEA